MIQTPGIDRARAFSKETGTPLNEITKQMMDEREFGKTVLTPGIDRAREYSKETGTPLNEVTKQMMDERDSK